MSKLNFKGCSRIQEVLLRYKLSKVEGFNMEATIDVLETIPSGMCNHYWYGGSVVEIYHKGYKFSIEAIGDVYLSLIDKKTNEEVARVKDKNNSACFYSEISPYIKNDTALENVLNGNSKKYTLDIHNNNWWECFVYDKTGEFHDLMWDLESDNIFDAITEVAENMDGVIIGLEGNETEVPA